MITSFQLPRCSKYASTVELLIFESKYMYTLKTENSIKARRCFQSEFTSGFKAELLYSFIRDLVCVQQTVLAEGQRVSHQVGLSLATLVCCYVELIECLLLDNMLHIPGSTPGAFRNTNFRYCTTHKTSPNYSISS